MKVIEALDAIPTDARICLYGAGGFGRHMHSRLTADRPDVRIPFFCDTFKHGRFCNLPIVAPETLVNERKDDFDLVLITAGPVSIRSIAEMLRKMGEARVWTGSRFLQKQIFYHNILSGNWHYNSFNIELTSQCNMACRFCGFRDRKTGHMDYALFRKIIDQIADQGLAQTIMFAGGGEPLMNPQLIEAVEYCRRRGLFVNLTTNGLNLTPEVHRDLRDSGLNVLTVSLHNLSPETFAYRRTAKEFADYFNQVLDAVDFHAANRFDMGLQIILMFDAKETGCTTSEAWGLPAVKADTRNAPELLQGLEYKLREIAGNNRLPCQLKLPDMVAGCATGAQVPVMGNIKMTFVGLDTNITVKRRYLETANKNQPECGIRLKPALNGTCDTFLQNPQILFNGTLMPCCTDALDSELALGQVTDETPITQLLKNETYRNLIRGFQKNEVRMPTCRYCLGTLYRDA